MIFNEEGVIHQGTFLLAEEAKIGIYTIRVTGKNSASCSFSVEEYVLPKFGVEIEGLSEFCDSTDPHSDYALTPKCE